MTHQQIIKAAAVLLILVLIVVILFYAKAFLVPIAFGGILAMLLLPIAKWLTKNGINRVISVLLSMLVLLSFFAGIAFFASYQVSDIAKNATQIEEQLTERYQQARKLVSEKLGVSKEKQEEMIKKQQSGAAGKVAALVTGIVSGIGSGLIDIVIVLVYIFLFMYFRHYIKRFILRMAPDQQRDNTLAIINNAKKVSQRYLVGLMMMIVVLWIMYGVGFSIAGVQNAIFFAILCGVLEVIPLIGNLIGASLTLLFAFMQGGETSVIVGIVITYGIVQFVQTYILEPLIVGSEVNINPLFTIVGLVAGELIWGLPGMILAIPIMGITKIICERVEPLKPYAELIGEEKKEDGGLKKKVKAWGKSLFSRRQ